MLAFGGDGRVHGRRILHSQSVSGLDDTNTYFYAEDPAVLYDYRAGNQYYFSVMRTGDSFTVKVGMGDFDTAPLLEVFYSDPTAPDGLVGIASDDEPLEVFDIQYEPMPEPGGLPPPGHVLRK